MTKNLSRMTARVRMRTVFWAINAAIALGLIGFALRGFWC